MEFWIPLGRGIFEALLKLYRRNIIKIIKKIKQYLFNNIKKIRRMINSIKLFFDINNFFIFEIFFNILFNILFYL